MSGPKFLDDFLQRLLTPKRVKVFAIVLAIEITIFLAGAVYPIPLATDVQISQTYTQQTQGIYTLDPISMWVEIFTHNAYDTLLELVPFVGISVIGIAAFITGQVLQAEAVIQSGYATNNGPITAITLFLFPHTIIEFSAYALAVTTATFFFIGVFRPKGPRREVGRTFVGGIVASFLLLAIAAAIETVTINMALIGALFWFPIIMGVSWLRKQYRQNLNTPTEIQAPVAVST